MLPVNIRTLMPHTAKNEVIVMPDPSNRTSSAADSISGGSGHRSPNKAATAENIAPIEKPSTDEPSTEVFAVFGVEPEIQAYAMAKYSRSALSMKESLREISTQKAEKFLNTFYFQYGHRSIADLAHIALAIERLSILAAIALADEQRWDGQERSTRYQDFKKSGYYTPDFGSTKRHGSYIARPWISVHGIRSLSAHMTQYLINITPKPDDMKQEAYERTLRARAFDISRYLLPLATNTSLGEIVNARTLETQVSHLLSHTHKEVRSLGELLKQAAPAPAYNVNHESCRTWWSRLGVAGVGRAGRAGIAARSASGADAGEICRSEFLRDGDATGVAADRRAS